jgi:branched-chain amino acid transport system ATP-binding protein
MTAVANEGVDVDPTVGLAVRDVSVSFSGLKALDGVTFDVPGGGVTALIGPNGAGKTTLLNCISGLYQSTGELFLDGTALSDIEPHQRSRRGIARTFQTPSLLDDHPAVDNVMLGGHSSGRRQTGGRAARPSERELRERSMSLLDRFGIAHLAPVRVGDLPHADRRRVETARALVSEPRVVLLDEPAAGLDEDEARDLLAVAAELSDTCVLVEHNMSLVMSVAQFVVVLAAGRVLATGTAAEVRENPAVIEAYLGDEVA